MATQPVPFLTVEQYLEIERAAEYKSEYIGGTMYAMSGGGFHHAFIAADTLVTLCGQLRGKKCNAVGSDLRLFCQASQVLTYPDVTIFCEPRQVLDNRKDTLTDATVIVEVLSPSTQNYDRSEKFRYYRGLPSFREYLLLAQDEIRAEHYTRQSDSSWLFREFTNADTEIVLDSIGCRFRLGDVYQRVEFES